MRRTPRPLRVKVLTRPPRVPVGVIAAAVFALVALFLLTLFDKGGAAGPGRLANTGSDLSPWAIAGVAAVILAGIAFLVIGRLRRRASANRP